MSESPEEQQEPQSETNRSGQALVERIHELENEKAAISLRLWKQRRRPSGMISYVLLIAGAVALIISILQASTILAFIGLSLTFWGVLFLFVKPVKYVKPSLIDSTAISSLETIHRVLSDLDYKGTAVHLPPLPYFLKGYKGGTVYISSEKGHLLPSANELIGEKAFIKNPKGICLVPPGVGLTNLYEEGLGKEFLQVDFEYLKANLPTLFVQDLEIATNLEMDKENNRVHVKIEGSIFKDLCRQVEALGNVCNSFGCPLCSSIACTLARTLGKPIIIEKAGLAPDGNTIEADFRMMEE